MTKSWWHKEFEIENKIQTPTQYLKDNYLQFSDREIAEKLSLCCNRKVTKNAVRKRRYRLDLYKDDYSQEQENVFEEGENYKEFNITQERPLSLEGIIRLYNVNTDVWEVDSFKINSWEVGAKAEEKDLHYIDGKVSGKITSEGLQIKQLYQTKVSFLRKEPIAINPTIHPIECDVNYELPELKKKEIVKELVFSDPHFGCMREKMYSDKIITFHDPKTLSIILEVCRISQPDIVRVLGDIFDFPEYTDRFARSPEFAFLTQPAINDAYGFFKKLREICPNTTIYIHEGNHDKRLQDMIIKHLPFAYGLKSADEIGLPPQLSVQRLLSLHKLGIIYIDSYPNDYSVSDNGLVEYEHGGIARSNPGSTAGAFVQKYDISKIFGHIHRIESASRTIWRASKHTEIQAHSFGCTCRLDGVVPGSKERQNWQQGFGIIHHTENSFNVIPYLIRNHEVVTQWGLIGG